MEIVDTWSRLFTFLQYFPVHLICSSTVDVAAGCAFVKYETKEQAVAAIEALNGKHKIEVREN